MASQAPSWRVAQSMETLSEPKERVPTRNRERGAKAVGQPHSQDANLHRAADIPGAPGGPDTWAHPQVAAGAASTAAFFLCEGLLGQHFEVVPNGVAEPQPGDLFLFPLASAGPGWWGAHAGVYCGDGEIIHLEGIVAKHGKSHLLRTRGPAKVLRKKGGLDRAVLQQRVRAAMDEVVEYNAVTCNCVHFALALLDLGQLATGTISPTLQ
ncbi:uncharacterized protein [Apteryx mantelli]|uniref:LRAT domain-containing protein n=1 Tax=Apteryx mantelli TaxID=2696672 RepID=A0ABM4FAC6_9AVES